MYLTRGSNLCDCMIFVDPNRRGVAMNVPFLLRVSLIVASLLWLAGAASADATFHDCQEGNVEGTHTLIHLDIRGGEPGQLIFVDWILNGQSQGLLSVTLDANGDYQSPPPLNWPPPPAQIGDEDELVIKDGEANVFDTQPGCWVAALPDEGNRSCDCDATAVESASWGRVKQLSR